ncbi:hypothetical protein EC988_006374 [Linderina pennispora]|nr:hypothetical protein EC988_006374 [Linderina pennispora]
MLFMFFSELRDYLRYKEDHLFTVDDKVGQQLQVNFGVTVAMPCAFIRVDVIDEGGTNHYMRSGIEMLPVSKTEAFKRAQGHAAINSLGNMHVHDIVAEAHRKQRGPKAMAEDRTLEGACKIAGNVHVNKISGVLHITAHGHGHGGAHVPHSMLNFTHHIDELSFGPFYPSLVNPLDDTMHLATEHFAGFKYFISVVPTHYIDASGHYLPTNQYAVNEYYQGDMDHSLFDSRPPGIFFEYGIEPVSVTIRERRGSFVTFVVRICAATSGVFVTVGIIHSLMSAVASTRRTKPPKSSSTGLLGAGAVTKADIDAPISL